VIAAQHVDLPALLEQAGILDGHLDRDHGVRAADVGIKARHVIQHADLDGLVLRVGGCCKTEGGTGQKGRIAARERRRHKRFPPMSNMRTALLRSLVPADRSTVSHGRRQCA
jgi:hypothetical protein